MRSGLTVLGVVIGITSIVAMTSLIRGFDQSLQDSISAAMGPKTIFIQRFGVTSFASGREFSELIKRPNLTVSDARALQEQNTTLQFVDIEMGVGAGPTQQHARILPGSENTPSSCSARRSIRGRHAYSDRGRPVFSAVRRSSSAQSCGPGHTAHQLLLPTAASTRSARRSASATISSWWSACSTNGLRQATFRVNQDDFVVIPYTTYQRVYGLRIVQSPQRGRTGGGTMQAVQIPGGGDDVQDSRVADIERIMRIRHGLKLDEPNDFDIVTQDGILKLWNQISQATFFALVVDLVDCVDGGRHRRDGDHVDSVTERRARSASAARWARAAARCSFNF